MLSTLPTELWIQILAFVASDEEVAPHILWCSIRRVSMTFKEAIETIFRDQKLRETSIQFDRPTHQPYNYLVNDTGPWRLNNMVVNPIFKFSHLSLDKATASFTDPEFYVKHKSHVANVIHDAMANTRFEKPTHIIRVGYDANDTPIPGLSFDNDNGSISFDWRGFFTAFYSEQYIVEKVRSISYRQNRNDFIETEGRQPKRTQGWLSNNARRTVRRKRIREQYASKGILDWKFQGSLREEDTILQQLKEERNMAKLSHKI